MLPWFLRVVCPVLSGLVLGLLASSAGCAASADDPVGEGGGAMSAAPANRTTFVSPDGPTAGLTVTFALDAGGGPTHRAASATFTRGKDVTKLACTSSGTTHGDGSRLVALDCTNPSQEGFAPGTNECRATFNYNTPSKETTVLAQCRNPHTITAAQKAWLTIVFGQGQFQIVPDQTFPDSKGEVGGQMPVPIVPKLVGTDVENDPFALQAMLVDAASGVIGKTPTLDRGQAIAPPLTDTVHSATAFLDLDHATVPVNVMVGNALASSRDVQLLAADGQHIASVEVLRDRMLTSLGMH
jgi:hypothetical protein